MNKSNGWDTDKECDIRLDTVDGYYYLHTNGDLIYKRTQPELDSDFVVRVWAFAPDREIAWIILSEALALGANRTRVYELALKWGVDDEDAQNFVKHGTKNLLALSNKEGRWSAVFADGKSETGYGTTALDALADLAKYGLSAQKRGL